MNGFECELKLSADTAVLKALRRNPDLKAMTVGAVRTRRLVSSYFDTPKRKLAAAGVSLRVRRKDGSYIQTLKSDSAYGGLMREETEQTVIGPNPDTELVRASKYGALLGQPGKQPELVLQFITDIRRTERMLLDPSGALVEYAIDQGVVRAGEAEAAICEIELELKSGDPESIFAIARPLVERYGLSVSLTSKAEMGYALAAGEEASSVKATPVRLSQTMSAGEAFRAIIGAALRQLTANEAATRAGRSSGIHQMRVALRRLRSAFKAFMPAFGEEVLLEMDDRARLLANALGPARDLDVFVEEILKPAQLALDEERSFALLSGEIEERRLAAWEAAREALQSTAYKIFLLDLAALALCGVRSPAADALAKPLATAVLEARFKKAAKRGDKVDRLAVPERHELRKDLKKLRYAAEFFSSLFPAKGQVKFFDLLSDLQDDLGYLNDVATARTILTGLTADLAKSDDAARAAEFGLVAGEIAGWHLGRAAGSPRKLKTDWEKFAKGRLFWRD